MSELEDYWRNVLGKVAPVVHDSKIEGYISIVCAATGWDREVARTEMQRVREATGMPFFRYAKNKCWLMGDEEVAQLNKRIIAAKEANIAQIVKDTGWSSEKAKKALSVAYEKGISGKTFVGEKLYSLNPDQLAEYAKKLKAEKTAQKRRTAVKESMGWSDEKLDAALSSALDMGIPEKAFCEKCLYELTEAELAEYAEVHKARKDQASMNTEYYIDVVCRRTGWSRDEVKQKMDDAKKHGVSNLKFVEKEYWKNDQAQQRRVDMFLKRDKKRVGSRVDSYVEKIREATGWTRGKIELEVQKAKLNCQCSYEDYFAYKMWKRTPEEQREYVTLGAFSKMRIEYNQHEVSKRDYDDKARFAELFSDQFNRVWFTNSNLTYEGFLDKINGLNRVIVKPLTATQGLGIFTRHCNESEEQNKELYAELIGMPPAIVEEYIVQHPEVMEFCPDSVNTLRITTLYFQGECKFLYSVFRMGRGAEVDNFHAGGIAAAVDLETGEVITNAADLDANFFETSPTTGKKIKGFVIPHWDKVLETCRAIAGRTPEALLVGWDFAITPDGVDLVEGNTGASYVVAQIPFVQDEVGLMDQMVRPYLPKELIY